jgi:hypothetical protein
MTFDPYTNRIQYGLLTDEEKAALLATGGPFEYCDPRYGEWNATPDPSRYGVYIYRAIRKPLPVPQDGDVWVMVDGGADVIPASVSAPPLAEKRIRAGYRLFREVKA